MFSPFSRSSLRVFQILSGRGALKSRIINANAASQFSQRPILNPLVLSNHNSMNFHPQKPIANQSMINNVNRFFATLPYSATSIDDAPTTLHTLGSFYKFIKQQSNQPQFDKKFLVCAQHNLGTTHDLYKVIQKLGANNIMTIGKNYSDHKGTINALRTSGITVIDCPKQTTINGFDKTYDQGIFKLVDFVEKEHKKSSTPKNQIILDDGGFLLDTPFERKHDVGIEQTTSGAWRTRAKRIPIILVASSYPKIAAESLMVARVTAQRITDKLKETEAKFPNFKLRKEPLIGIIGLGNIGLSLTKELLRAGHKHFVLCDSDQEKTRQALRAIRKLVDQMPYKLAKDIKISTAKGRETVHANADLILGCTGKDITSLQTDPSRITDVFDSITHPKILGSCSSRTAELSTLLVDKEVKDPSNVGEDLDPLADVRFKNGFGAELLIWQSGTPLTFNQSEHALPPHQADLVRTLLAISVVQADFMQQCMENGMQVPPTNYKLSPTLVQHFTKIWLANLSKEERKSFEFPTDLTDINAITQKSGGELYEPFEKIAQAWLSNIEPSLSNTSKHKHS